MTTTHTTRPPHTVRPGAALRRGTVAACAALALTLGSASAVLAAPAPSGSRAAAPDHGARSGRGELVSLTPIDRLTRDELVGTLGEIGMDAAPVRYGVATYRVVYRTVGTDGAPTTASALLVLPEGAGTRLSVVSENHGTLAYRGDAPSTGSIYSRVAADLYASTGRAVVAADYLGLGEGPGTHPFMDTSSEVSAALDALRAAVPAAHRLGVTLTRDTFVTGFAQGGQVSTALARALRHGADRRFTVRAVAPVSAPFDFEHVQLPGLVDGRVRDLSGVFYAAYFLVAQNRTHPFYEDPAEVFRAPYAEKIESLFDGDHPEPDIFEELPATVRELVTDAFLEQLERPSGAFLEAVRAVDGTCDWKPAAPVRLYTSTGNPDVPVGNTTSCAADLTAHGARVQVVDQGADVDHFGSFTKSAPRIAEWFATFDR